VTQLPPSGIDYLTHLGAEAERFAQALEHGPLDAPVAGCPGWDVARLGEHLGTVHRWARLAALEARRPEPQELQPPPTDTATLSNWFRDGATALLATLRDLDPGAPTWHPFPAEQVVGVWWRRQAQETQVHRWDAEQAVGITPVLDPGLASDGIDEYFAMMLPRLVSREQLAIPAGSLHVHCTDVRGEWLVRAEEATLVVTREHAKGDAALRGGAAALLLRLWGRPVPDGAIDVIGDTTVAGGWLALGGV
jgi:uncharacterized protein (TIGR03083 family)